MRVDREMKEIKVVMEALDEQFAGNEMQDATKFLGRFLDELKNDVSSLWRSPKCVDEFSPELSFLAYNNFLYEKEESLVCCSCEAETRCRNRDMSMWCNTTSHKIKVRNVSIQSLVEQSMAKETRRRRCCKCGCEDATVTSELVRLPRVLIIFLKRYKYSNQNKSGKVSQPVNISETICLSSLVSDTVVLPDISLPVPLFPIQRSPNGLSLPPNHLVTSLPPTHLNITPKYGQLIGREESHCVDDGDKAQMHHSSHNLQQVWTPSYSKVVNVQNFSFSNEGLSEDLSILRPTQKLDESGRKSAFENLTKEAGLGGDCDYQMDLEKTENNMKQTGMIEHTFQLHSVVSHYGTSAIAGHYVADVFRFCSLLCVLCTNNVLLCRSDGGG